MPGNAGVHIGCAPGHASANGKTLNHQCFSSARVAYCPIVGCEASKRTAQQMRLMHCCAS
eukprot:355627-Chlamydomonas_euryale.AAC.9